MAPRDEMHLGHSPDLGDFEVCKPTTNEKNRLWFDFERAALEGDSFSANESFRPYANLEPPPSMQAMPLAPLFQQLQLTSGQMSELGLAPSVTLNGGSMNAASSYTIPVPTSSSEIKPQSRLS